MKTELGRRAVIILCILLVIGLTGCCTMVCTAPSSTGLKLKEAFEQKPPPKELKPERETKPIKGLKSLLEGKWHEFPVFSLCGYEVLP